MAWLPGASGALGCPNTPAPRTPGGVSTHPGTWGVYAPPRAPGWPGVRGARWGSLAPGQPRARLSGARGRCPHGGFPRPGGPGCLYGGYTPACPGHHWARGRSSFRWSSRRLDIRARGCPGRLGASRRAGFRGPGCPGRLHGICPPGSPGCLRVRASEASGFRAPERGDGVPKSPTPGRPGCPGGRVPRRPGGPAARQPGVRGVWRSGVSGCPCVQGPEVRESRGVRALVGRGVSRAPHGRRSGVSRAGLGCPGVARPRARGVRTPGVSARPGRPYGRASGAFPVSGAAPPSARGSVLDVDS
ncbi:hypothetical protein CFP59_06333 [Streptomyces malaysiensis subsp. malaysiensis]|nr:hypothetical protein CFP59_06333 [Streptomyces sp. M56]